MDDFAVRRGAGELDVLVFHLDQDLLDLPVDVPRRHRGVAPRLLRVAGVDIHFDQAVVGHSNQLLE